MSHSRCCNEPISKKEIAENGKVCPFCGHYEDSYWLTDNVVTRIVKTKKRFLLFFWRTIHERLEYVDDSNKDEYEKEAM